MITLDTNHKDIQIQLNETAEMVATEFFRIVFPYKFRKDGTVWDTGYLEEWAGRFRKGSAWACADYNSRRAILKLGKTTNLITIWERVKE